MRRTFAVGRVSRKATEIVWVGPESRPRIPGPWTLRAVVRPGRPERGRRRPGARQ